MGKRERRVRVAPEVTEGDGEPYTGIIGCSWTHDHVANSSDGPFKPPQSLVFPSECWALSLHNDVAFRFEAIFNSFKLTLKAPSTVRVGRGGFKFMF